MIDREKLLAAAVVCLMEQLQEAHNNMTKGGANCDGGCSYEDSLAIGRDALDGIANSLIDGRLDTILLAYRQEQAP